MPRELYDSNSSQQYWNKDVQFHVPLLHIYVCKYRIFLLQVLQSTCIWNLDLKPAKKHEVTLRRNEWMTAWVHAYALCPTPMSCAILPWKRRDVLMQFAGHWCWWSLDRAYPFYQRPRVSSGVYRLPLVVHIMSSFATGNDENSSAQTSDPNCTTNNGSYNFIEKALECPLCLSLICEPLSISCGHSFCRVCLVKSLRRLALVYARLHGWKLRSRTEIQKY